MKQRKTINVMDLVEALNRFLASPGSTPSQRAGVIIAVEHALNMAHAYRGYNFLPSERNEDGTLQNVYDETRRFYYVSNP